MRRPPFTARYLHLAPVHRLTRGDRGPGLRRCIVSPILTAQSDHQRSAGHPLRSSFTIVDSLVADRKSPLTGT